MGSDTSPNPLRSPASDSVAVKEYFVESHRVKMLSDDRIFGRPAHTHVFLSRRPHPSARHPDEAHVVTKLDFIGNDQVGVVDSELEMLLSVPECDTILRPRAFLINPAMGELRMVLPFAASESTVCLDLLRLVFPCGPQANAVTLTRAELNLFTLDMVDALTTLHAHGITSNSIQPSNIFVEFSAASVRRAREVHRFMLADYRRTRLFREADSAQANDLPPEAFLAPEETASKRSPAGDVYRLGVTLFWLLTKNTSLRVNPYSAHDTRLIFSHAHSSEETAALLDVWLKPISEFDPVLAPFATLVQNCVEKDPKLRPSLSQVRSSVLPAPIVP